MSKDKKIKEWQPEKWQPMQKLSLSVPKSTIPDKTETKLEKALKLSNDELIAKAIQDILKRDEIQNERLN